MKSNDPYSCSSATHLNNLFRSHSLCSTGRDGDKGGFQGHRAVSSSPSYIVSFILLLLLLRTRLSLELLRFLSPRRSRFLSCNSILFRCQGLYNITLSFDSLFSRLDVCAFPCHVAICLVNLSTKLLNQNNNSHPLSYQKREQAQSHEHLCMDEWNLLPRHITREHTKIQFKILLKQRLLTADLEQVKKRM